MRGEGQSVEQWRCDLADIAVMVGKEVEIAIGTSERVGFFDSCLQGHAGHGVIDGLPEMLVVNLVVEDQVPNGLQQLAVRTHSLGDLVLIVFECLPSSFMPRRQTDIEDVNALIGQVHESLLEQREQERIAPLWPQTPQSLHRLFAPQTREEFLAVWIESGHLPLIDFPLLEPGELVERIEQGW